MVKGQDTRLVPFVPTAYLRQDNTGVNECGGRSGGFVGEPEPKNCADRILHLLQIELRGLLLYFHDYPRRVLARRRENRY
jgi:hypothetical protein